MIFFLERERDQRLDGSALGNSEFGDQKLLNCIFLICILKNGKNKIVLTFEVGKRHLDMN
jgi:hypothetical protein